MWFKEVHQLPKKYIIFLNFLCCNRNFLRKKYAFMFIWLIDNFFLIYLTVFRRKFEEIHLIISITHCPNSFQTQPELVNCPAIIPISATRRLRYILFIINGKIFPDQVFFLAFVVNNG